MIAKRMGAAGALEDCAPASPLTRPRSAAQAHRYMAMRCAVAILVFAAAITNAPVTRPVNAP